MTEKNKKDYSKGKIYKIEPICDFDDGDIYVGSTCQKLSQRMSKHRNKYKEWKLGKYHNVTSFKLFDKYGVTNCQIVLIESIDCKTKDELHAREAFYIRTLKCVNKCVPLRTHYEYYCDNIEILKQNKKIYREKNKDAIKQSQKIHYEKNKDDINDKQKEYRDENRDKIKIIKKEYYKNNKEIISEKEKVKYNCECGSICRKGDKARHFRTNKHLKYIKTLN
jgi:hypothetical protein